MKIVDSAAMRQLDERTINEAGVPGTVLMDRAGAAIAARLRGWLTARSADGVRRPVVLLAGAGNNGGDVFAAARHLRAADATTLLDVVLLVPRERVRGDALDHLEQYEAAGGRVRVRADEVEWAGDAGFQQTPGVIVDGLLGTGAEGAPRGALGAAMAWCARQAEVAWVLAIDVPTGVDADQGEAVDQAVRADVTVTMGLPKKGLLTTAAADYVGRLEVAELGFPAALVDQLAADETRQVIDAGDVRTWLPRRQRDTHKGDFGRVLIVGGARCYPGAVQLAARAALRAGAGLVTVLVPDFLYGVMASGTPEWIVETTPSNPTGSVEGDAARSWRDRLREFDAVLVGPGMTSHADTALWVRQWLRDVQVPLVLDADALNVLAGQAHWLERASGPVVVTPHPGEFARLFGVDQATLQADRAGHARRAADQSGATVLLKGHHSVVAHPDQPAWINLTGNPGMATAGAGDVLAGVVVALLGQGIAPFEAARAAAYLHGRAGDLAADRLGEAGVIASDLIEHLPLAAANLR